MRCIFCFLVFFLLNNSSVFSQCNSLCNTDFENNQVTISVGIIDASQVPCWHTTASDNMIEVWHTGFNGVPSYSGSQFIELNAYEVSTLFQNFSAVPGASISVSFAHRGRAGTDIMSVDIGPVGGPYTSLGSFSDGDLAWGYYTQGYVVPLSMGTNYTIRFNSVSAAGGNPALGNFLDAISVNTGGGLNVNISSTGVTCANLNNGSAIANVVSGAGPYTYSWSPSGGNSSVASALAAGVYTVYVTGSNGCIGNSTVNIVAGVTVAGALTIQNAICNTTGSAQLALIGGTAPYTYTWLPTGGNAAFSNALTVGNYTVKATSAEGCMFTKTLTISGVPLGVTVSAQDVKCFGGNDGMAQAIINTGIAPYTYTWMPGGSNSSLISSLVAGTYSLTAMDANGCASSSTLQIGQPTQLTASITTHSASCITASNGEAQATVSGGTAPYQYAWQGGGNTPSVTGLAVGNYSCLLSDSHACSVLKTLTISAAPLLQLSVNNGSVCKGNSYTLIANGAVNYTWSPGNNYMTNYVVTPSIATVYSVTGEDAAGCQSSTIAVVMVDTLPTVFAGNDTVVNMDEPLVLIGNGSDQFGWLAFDRSELSCNFCPVTIENPQKETCYILEGLNANNCKNRDTMCVEVIHDWNIYVPNSFSPNNDGLNDVFIPVGYGLDEIEINIYDRWGTLVFKTKELKEGWNGFNKNKLCKEDTYVYKIYFSAMNSTRSYERIGRLTLIK